MFTLLWKPGNAQYHQLGLSYKEIPKVLLNPGLKTQYLQFTHENGFRLARISLIIKDLGAISNMSPCTILNSLPRGLKDFYLTSCRDSSSLNFLHHFVVGQTKIVGYKVLSNKKFDKIHLLPGI